MNRCVTPVGSCHIWNIGYSQHKRKSHTEYKDWSCLDQLFFLAKLTSLRTTVKKIFSLLFKIVISKVERAKSSSMTRKKILGLCLEKKFHVCGLILVGYLMASCHLDCLKLAERRVAILQLGKVGSATLIFILALGDVYPFKRIYGLYYLDVIKLILTKWARGLKWFLQRKCKVILIIYCWCMYTDRVYRRKEMSL